MANPKWMEPDPQDTKKRKWRGAQKKTAKLLGGREQPASGALWCYKGDVTAPGWLAEVKQTDGKGFRVTLEILHKIQQEALDARKTPLLVLEIGTERYYVLREMDFKSGLKG